MVDEDVPEELRYTREHEWVRVAEDGVLRVGITDHAQGKLGDVVFVTLPAVGDRIAGGDPMAEVESTKSVADVFAPVSGTVVERNSALEVGPESVNESPYERGWLVDLRPDEPTAVLSLMSAADYRDFVAED